MYGDALLRANNRLIDLCLIFRVGWTLVMPKISGHGHVLILTDEACIDGRIYLQKREIVKECTGSGPVGEPPMLKSNDCYLNSNIRDKSIEVRKRECTLIQEVLCLYRRL